MSDESGGIVPPPELDRNPVGWLILGVCMALMVMSELASYFSPNPSMALVRARIQEQLQSDLVVSSVDRPRFERHLAEGVATLRPKLDDSPETQLLYAELRTEQGKPVLPSEIAALKSAKKASERAAYQIYSSQALSRDQARVLAAQMPADEFLYKLAAVQGYEKAGDKGPRAAMGANSRAALAILGGSLVLLGFIGLALWWAFIWARANGYLKPKGFPMGNLSVRDADRVALRCSQIFVAYLAIGLVGGLLVRGSGSLVLGETIIEFVAVGAVLLMSLAPADGKMLSLRTLGISGEGFGRHALWGLAGAVANIPILAVVQTASLYLFRSLPTPEHPVTVEIGRTSSPLVLIELAIVAAILAPIIEEQMFRGTMFPALAAVFKSPVWAALASSLIFGMIHPTGIPAWPGLAAIGCMSCFLAYQTKSLVPSIVMHGVHNLATLAFTILALR